MRSLPAIGFRVQGWLRTAFDRANPILARGIRQELRNSTFFVVYLLLVSVSGVAAIVLAVLARDGQRESGAMLFAILGGSLTFTLMIPQAFNAYRAMVRERDDDTWDLIQLTGIRPGRLLRGMLWASFFQGLYYLAAIAPFMVMAYLLRGIDLVTIVLLISYCICSGLVASSLAIFWGCLGNNKQSRAALGLLLSIGLLGLWAGNCVGWANLDDFMQAIAMLMRHPTEMFITVLIGLNATVLACVLLMGLAASLVTFPADNRSTLPRTLWILAWLNLCAWVVILGVAEDIDAEDWGTALSVVGMWGMFWFLPYGFLAITEDYGLSRRQARSIERPRRWLAPFVWILGPGAARGRHGWIACWTVCLILALGGATESSMVSYGSRFAREVAGIALGTFCYGLIYFQIGELLSRGPLARFVTRPAQRRAVILVVLITVVILPLLIVLMLGFERSLVEWVNPFMGIARMVSDLDHSDGVSNLVAEQPLLMILALGAGVLFVVQGSANQRIELVRIQADSGTSRRQRRGRRPPAAQPSTPAVAAVEESVDDPAVDGSGDG